MQHLVEWCTFKNEDYDYLKRIYEANVQQYIYYLNHATAYLGGAYEYLGVEGENTPHFTPVSKEKQQEAITWLINELANSEWLLNKDIEKRLGSQRHAYYKQMVESFDQLMSGYIFQRIETYRPVYSSEEYLSDLSDLIWGLNKDGELTETEKVLQQAFVHNLISMTYASKHHLKKTGKDQLFSHQLNTAEALTAGNASKINYVDHFVLMATTAELEKAGKYIKKHLKGPDKAHFTLLYKIIRANQ